MIPLRNRPMSSKLHPEGNFMKLNENDYYPGMWRGGDAPNGQGQTPPQGGRQRGVLVSLLVLVTVVSVLLTYTLTSAAKRSYYTEKLAAQQEEIDRLKNNELPSTDGDFEKLEILAALFEYFSYYAGKVSDEALMDAVLKAYAEATGDVYAEYYTEAEYAEISADNVGDYVGIGVSVVNTAVTVSGVEYQAFQVVSIYENGTAAGSTLRVGDFIYRVKNADGVYQTVGELGYTKAISMIKGEKGTLAEFSAFRPTSDGYESLDFSIVRDEFESVSVTYFTKTDDETVGVVRISSFDLTTPGQLKQAVKALQSDGATHFVFDVRNNPGGDLQSIKAVLTYFLQEGDLILSAIDRNGKTVTSYCAEPILFLDEYAACNVQEDEIGMFADLDMVVLCNENTASAAEVFTATLRDYGLATVVGETTFGKGIMQSFFPLSRLGNYSGYVKMTTYAYVTRCGVTYHEIGIVPDEEHRVALSEEAKGFHFYLLPQEKDNQLQAAFAIFEEPNL